jgi:hypothetical protein
VFTGRVCSHFSPMEESFVAPRRFSLRSIGTVAAKVKQKSTGFGGLDPFPVTV